MAMRKPLNSNDLELSLTGSQISARSSTKANSVLAPKHTNPTKQKLSNTGHSSKSVNGNCSSKKLKKCKSTSPGRVLNSSHVPHSSSSRNTPIKNSEEEFLSLFESRPESKTAQSKKGPPPIRDKKNLKGSNNAAGCTNVSQSIFYPTSGRSSTLDDDYLSDTDRYDRMEAIEQRLQTGFVNRNFGTYVDSGIANNMTSQAMAPTNKTRLSDLENSYQNIKHKHPVNQHVQQILSSQPANRFGSDKKKRHMAACQIQRWFRRHRVRTRAGNAALKRLLEKTRLEYETNNSGLTLVQSSIDQSDEQRRQIREEKAKRARQQAIQELKQKREEKRQENRFIAEEEISRLKSSGKLRKSSQLGNPKTLANHGRAATGGNQSHSSGVTNPSPRNNIRTFRRQQSTSNEDITNIDYLGASSRHTIDELFENNSPRISSNDAIQIDASSSTDSGNHGRDKFVTSSRATKTTIETLMDTLKKLEEEEKLPTGHKDKNETPSNWRGDLEHRSADDDFLTAENLARLNDPIPSQSIKDDLHDNHKDNVKKSGLLTDEKLKSIMSFLDEVEMADRVSEIDNVQDMRPLAEAPQPYNNSSNGAAGLTTTSSLGAAAGGSSLVPTDQEVEQMEQAAVVASQVTNTVLSQRLQLEEKQRSIAMLQKALNQQRELTVRHSKQTEKELNQQFRAQKEDYEGTIARHLTFIDQLIDDKKSLSEKCEKLVVELKSVDKKYTDKMTALQDSHSVEIRKLKDVSTAAEKLRREKWIDEKTKKIKEMTVKGLEPEIQRLIAKHKAEVKKLKSIHEAELLASDERAGSRYIKMTEELRDQLSKEKEAACARERDLARQTYEKQMEQEEENYQQQRRRLYTEVREEKERLNNQAQRQRQELDRLQRQLEDSQRDITSAMKEEYDKAAHKQEHRHETELNQLKEQLSIERTAWEENYKKQQDTWLTTRERELKEKVRKERDKEIEMVISRLEDDSERTREECERVAENRIKRTRDKYESEMTEIERNERQITEKYNKVKATLAEFEGENERMKVVLKQKDKEINDVKELLDRLNKERDRVSDVIRQEFTDRIVATEEENRRFKQDMAELKAKHRVEIERIKTETEVIQKAKQDEMEEVHKRVKQAIIKKEEVVTQMKQQYQAAMKRADHLEGLLEQQRKQLLHKK